MNNSKLVPYYILARGSFNRIKEILDSKRTSDADHAVIFIDQFFDGKDLLDMSQFASQDVIIYANTKKEPETGYIDILTDTVRENGKTPCAIVGIGGGSTLDIAKAVSIMYTNPGKAVDYQGWNLPLIPPLFKMGVPTIAGTGAEFTRTSVLTGPVKKLGINSDFSVFDQVILDADLMKTVPKDQFFYTAMDCFVHNEESLLGRINDTLTIALAEKSQDLMKDVFLGEMDHEKLLIASSLGGVAVANSSVGVCHPLSYGLSIELGLPHGFSICVAFNQLEEFYPNVKVFQEILKKHNIVLPKIIDDSISEEQLDRMAKAALMNDKPLSNAFGDDWKNIFTHDKVKNILRRM